MDKDIVVELDPEGNGHADGAFMLAKEFRLANESIVAKVDGKVGSSSIRSL